MKARFITDADLPGKIIIEGETPEEQFILRNFFCWPQKTGEPHRLAIGNATLCENTFSICIEQKPTPAP